MIACKQSLTVPKEGQIDQKSNSQNCRKPENIFVGFVPEEQHPGQTADTTTKQCQPQQRSFRDAPATPFGLELIVTKQQEIDEI